MVTITAVLMAALSFADSYEKPHCTIWMSQGEYHSVELTIEGQNAGTRIYECANFLEHDVSIEVRELTNTIPDYDRYYMWSER
jgi:hypothetical protein